MEPTEEQVLEAVRSIRAANPGMGVKKLVSETKRAHPDWSVGAKEVRQAITTATEADAAAAAAAAAAVASDSVAAARSELEPEPAPEVRQKEPATAASTPSAKSKRPSSAAATKAAMFGDMKATPLPKGFRKRSAKGIGLPSGVTLAQEKPMVKAEKAALRRVERAVGSHQDIDVDNLPPNFDLVRAPKFRHFLMQVSLGS